MRISDWSSDVCSSDLHVADTGVDFHIRQERAESAGTGYGTRTPAQRQGVENLPRYATAFALRSNDRRVAGKFGIGYQVGTVMPHRPAQSPTVLLQVHSVKSAEVQRERPTVARRYATQVAGFQPWRYLLLRLQRPGPIDRKSTRLNS